MRQQLVDMMKMRDGFSQLSLRSEMLRWNTFMRLQLMPFMKCWWTLEQRDVFVLLSGRETRRMLPSRIHVWSHRQENRWIILDVVVLIWVLLGSPARLKVAFTILKVRRPILSVGSLLKHGHRVIFDRANPHLPSARRVDKVLYTESRWRREETRLLSLVAVYPPCWPL